MFTGIVTHTEEIRSIVEADGVVRLLIASVWSEAELSNGESIAVQGVCLTLAGWRDGCMEFDVVPETLRHTTLTAVEPGTLVNLERSLQVGDRLSGHFVTGHVDEVGVVAECLDIDGDVGITIDVSPETLTQITSKGSVAVDGVSLTVGEVGPRGFQVFLVPYTLSITTLDRLQPGHRVNIETDILAKYVCEHLRAHQGDALLSRDEASQDRLS